MTTAVASDLAKKVHDALSDNYPEDTIKWVTDADWDGPKRVPLASIQMDRRPGGRDFEKVAGIAKGIAAGSPGAVAPVVLVKTPGSDKLKVADGYHRTLARRRLAQSSVPAYVGTVEDDSGPWDREMHDRKLNTGKRGIALLADAWTAAGLDAAGIRAGVCTGPGPCDTTPIGPGKNWVNKVGGLPLYIRAIAQALLRKGIAESDAVSLAVGTVRRWSKGEGNVTPATRARAAKALAEWEAKKAAADGTRGSGAYAAGHPFFGNQYSSGSSSGPTIYGNAHPKGGSKSTGGSAKPVSNKPPAAEVAYLKALHNAEVRYLKALQKSQNAQVKAYLKGLQTAQKNQVKRDALLVKNEVKSAQKITKASTAAAETVNSMPADARALVSISREVPAGYAWIAGNGSVVLVPEAEAAAQSGSRDMGGIVTESSSAGDLLPVQSKPVPPVPRQALFIGPDAHHAFRGSDPQACSVCGRPAVDAVHSKKTERTGKRHRGPIGHLHMSTGHVGSSPHRARLAQKIAFESDADQVEPKFTGALTSLFDAQEKATLARLTGKRGKQMMHRAQQPPEQPPGTIVPPQLSVIVPDAASVFDISHWAGRTADAATAGYQAAADLARARVRAQLGPSVEGADDSSSIGSVTDILAARSNRMANDVTQTTFNQIQDQLAQGVQAGESVPQLAKRVRSVFAQAKASRASLIARTETIGALNEAANGYAKNLPAGIVGRKQWLAHHDNRTRPTHRIADGQEVPISSPFIVGGSLMQFPGDPAAPPDEVCNCFPGWVKVDWPGLRAVTRRWYDGYLVEVRLADGRHLAGTPNHPILRADGMWVPLESLDCGDDLVSARFRGHSLGAPHPYRRPTEISEVHRLASIQGSAQRIDGRPPDFHGDGIDSEVDVVAVKRLLGFDQQPATDEEVAQLGLSLADKARLAHGRTGGATLVASGAFQVLQRHGGRAPSPVGVASEFTPLGDGQPSHADSVRLAARPHRQAHSIEPMHDGRSRDSEMLRQRENARSLLVATSQVVAIERYAFSGHVFNLDTGDGWYSANGISSANCRCSQLYLPATAGLPRPPVPLPPQPLPQAA